MGRVALDTKKTDGPQPDRPRDSSRTVVERGFIVSYGARQLTADLMTTGYVQPNEAASLEAAIDALIRDSQD